MTEADLARIETDNLSLDDIRAAAAVGRLLAEVRRLRAVQANLVAACRAAQTILWVGQPGGERSRIAKPDGTEEEEHREHDEDPVEHAHPVADHPQVFGDDRKLIGGRDGGFARRHRLRRFNASARNPNLGTARAPHRTTGQRILRDHLLRASSAFHSDRHKSPRPSEAQASPFHRISGSQLQRPPLWIAHHSSCAMSIIESLPRGMLCVRMNSSTLAT